MENARREQSHESLSIHLVPKKGSGAVLSANVPVDPFQPLSLRPSTVRRGPAPLSILDPMTVLRELFELLEDYSPVWYTEENHNRAVAALKGRVL